MVSITLLPGDSTSGACMYTFSWRGDNAPDIKETFVVGNTNPNHMSFKPYEGTTAYWWHDNEGPNDNLFSMSSDNSTATVVMDIHFEYIINDGAVTSQALTNPAAFTGYAARNLPIGTLEFQAVDLSAVG
jgi:hypothetical protein